MIYIHICDFFLIHVCADRFKFLGVINWHFNSNWLRFLGFDHYSTLDSIFQTLFWFIAILFAAGLTPHRQLEPYSLSDFLGNIIVLFKSHILLRVVFFWGGGCFLLGGNLLYDRISWLFFIMNVHGTVWYFWYSLIHLVLFDTFRDNLNIWGIILSLWNSDMLLFQFSL